MEKLKSSASKPTQYGAPEWGKMKRAEALFHQYNNVGGGLENEKLVEEFKKIAFELMCHEREIPRNTEGRTSFSAIIKVGGKNEDYAKLDADELETRKKMLGNMLKYRGYKKDGLQKGRGVEPTRLDRNLHHMWKG